MKKARVFTVVKGQTYDPQGTVINSAAKQLGIKHIKDVKAGRHFLLLFEDSISDEDVKANAEEAAVKLLHNDIIEDYDIAYEL
jgi:phosphoribosylformylglycinamidine synthase